LPPDDAAAACSKPAPEDENKNDEGDEQPESDVESPLFTMA